MRLSNRSKAPIYSFIGTLLAMITLVGVAAYVLERYKFDLLGYESVFFIIVPVFFWIWFYKAGRQIFEYDSDGEALNFKNRNVITFLGKSASDEFPKYKLIKYEVVNMLFFKHLYVTISSKKNNAVTLKYDISYLRKKEIKDLKTSLNKVVKENREYKDNNSN